MKGISKFIVGLLCLLFLLFFWGQVGMTLYYAIFD